MAIDTSSILVFLRQKLETAVSERETLKTQLDAVAAKIESKSRFAPKKPSMSAEGFDSRLVELEQKQRNSSMSLAAEKELLRTMADLRKEKATMAEYTAYSTDLDALHATRKETSDKLRTVSSSVRELREGVRKLEVLQRVKDANPGLAVTPLDITNDEVAVAEEHLGRLIGKKGAGLKEIEQACGVMLDVEDVDKKEGGGAGGAGSAPKKAHAPGTGSGAVIRITGLPAGIARAKDRIAGVTAQEEVTIQLSAPIISFLISRSGQPIKDLEASLDLRIKLEKEEHKAAVRGLPESIAQFRRTMTDAEKSKAVIPLDARVVPSVIGKGGANFKKLREETGVEVDVTRAAVPAGGDASAAPATLTLCYVATQPGSDAAAAISRAKAFIASLVDENTEHEEAVPIPRDAIAWLVGKGGERIQAYQKEAGVYARVARKEEQPHYHYGSSDAAVVLKGTKEALVRAKPLFTVLMHEYTKCNVSLKYTASQARAIIGPGGATIKKLRAETGATIEVDEATGGAAPKAAAASGDKDEKKPRVNRADEAGLPVGMALVTIRGEPDKVITAQATVAATIAGFKELQLPTSSGVLTSLVRNKGEAVQKLETETGATVTILRDAEAAAMAVGRAKVRPATLPIGAAPAGFVVIGGNDAALAVAESRLREMAASKQEVSVPLPDSGALGEVMGKGGANIKALQEETGTEVDVDKAAGVLRVVGTADAIAAAEAKLRSAFEKYSKENDSLTVDKSLVPALVGKGGVNIKALQEETGTQIHVESGTGEIRIHGPQEAVQTAKAKIITLCKMDAGNVADSFAVDVAILGRLIGKAGANLRKLEEQHSVSIAVDTTTGLFTIRGDAAAVATAKVALKKQVREASKLEVEVEIPQERLGGIIGSKGVKLRALEQATHTNIDLPRDRTLKTVTVRVRGSAPAVAKAKAALGALAAGKVVRCLPRLPAHVNVLAGTVDRLAEGGSHVSSFPCEPMDEGVDAATLTAMVLVEGTNEAGVARTAQAIDRVLGMRFGDAYGVVSVPAGMVDALAGRDASASSSSSAAAALKEGEEAAAEEAAPEAAAPSTAGPSVASLKSEFGCGGQLEASGSPYVALWGESAAVAGAKAKLSAAVAEFNQRHGEVSAEVWMLPTIIGKQGAGIKKLESDTGCKIQVEREGSSGKPAILLAAPSPAVLSSGKAKVEELITGMAKRRVLLQVPPPAFGGIIGKGGANIRALQEETGASLDLDRDLGCVAVRGPTEEAVNDAVTRIKDIVSEAGFGAREVSEHELAALSKTIDGTEAEDAQAVIGKGGATIRDLQDETGAYIGVDKATNAISIKGPSAEVVARAVRAVEKIIDAARRDRAAAKAAAAHAPASAPAGSFAAAAATSAPAAAAPKALAGVPIGGAPLTDDERLKMMSKNARRRAKLKEKKAAGGADEEEEEEVAAPPAPAPAAAAPAFRPVFASAAPAVAAAPHAPVHVAPPAVPVAAPKAAAPVAKAAAPAAAAGKTAAPKQQSADELLQMLLGDQYKSLLAGVGSSTAAAAAPAAAPVAPIVPPATSSAVAPPPGFSPTPAAARVAAAAAAAPATVKPVPVAAAVPAPAPAPAPAGPVWGRGVAAAKPAAAAAGGAPAAAPSLDDALAMLGLGHLGGGAGSAFPSLAAPAAPKPAAAAGAGKPGAKPATSGTRVQTSGGVNVRL